MFSKMTKKIKNIIFHKHLRAMDREWSYYFGSCLGMYPPSYDSLYTPEELECMMDEELETVRKKIEQL